MPLCQRKFSPHPPTNTAGVILLFNSTCIHFKYHANEESTPVYLFKTNETAQALLSFLTLYCRLHTLSNV